MVLIKTYKGYTPRSPLPEFKSEDTIFISKNYQFHKGCSFTLRSKESSRYTEWPTERHRYISNGGSSYRDSMPHLGSKPYGWGEPDPANNYVIFLVDHFEKHTSVIHLDYPGHYLSLAETGEKEGELNYEPFSVLSHTAFIRDKTGRTQRIEHIDYMSQASTNVTLTYDHSGKKVNSITTTSSGYHSKPRITETSRIYSDIPDPMYTYNGPASAEPFLLESSSSKTYEIVDGEKTLSAETELKATLERHANRIEVYQTIHRTEKDTMRDFERHRMSDMSKDTTIYTFY